MRRRDMIVSFRAHPLRRTLAILALAVTAAWGPGRVTAQEQQEDPRKIIFNENGWVVRQWPQDPGKADFCMAERANPNDQRLELWPMTVSARRASTKRVNPDKRGVGREKQG
jgi:hypothetical protein